MPIISWLLSPMAGFMSVIFVVIAWGGFLATGLAIVGLIRKRCAWSAVLMYAAMILVGSLLFRGVFWASEYFAEPDTVSTALFWGAAVLGGIGALSAFPKMIKDIWKLTNSVQIAGK